MVLNYIHRDTCYLNLAPVRLVRGAFYNLTPNPLCNPW